MSGGNVLSRLEEDLVMRQEYELWEAARCLNTAAINKYLGPQTNVICNDYLCSGEEYVLTIPVYELSQYTIEGYEAVSISPEVIQNYYQVYLTTADLEQEKACHVTSTWRKFMEGWKIVFHMRTQII